MKIDTFLHKSENHQHHNEDALIIESISKDWIVGAVIDGCSSGIESSFISGLYIKLIRKAIKTLPFLEKVIPEYSLEKMDVQLVTEVILNQIFDETKKISSNLLLSIEEVLATLLIMVYNKSNQELYICISGDGFYMVNDRVFEIQQNNVPDFMGYHLKSKFEDWYSKHTTHLIFQNVSSAGIATDGISKFNQEDKNKLDSESAEIFFTRTKKITCFNHAFDYLVNTKKLNPIDDIAIIGLWDK